MPTSRDDDDDDDAVGPRAAAATGSIMVLLCRSMSVLFSPVCPTLGHLSRPDDAIGVIDS